MPGFFAGRRDDEIGLVVFLNAGDPPLDALEEIVLLLDAARVDCLELAIPFPNSPTDGPVILRSAQRALQTGVDAAAVLEFVTGIRPRLTHLKIALLVDWRHTLKAVPLEPFLAAVRTAGADALLVHGLPPRMRQAYYAAAARAGQPVVTTCYATSAPAVLDEAGRHGSAYVYLAAQYGKTGSDAPDYRALAPVLGALRQRTQIPIAVGFGVKERSHVEALGAVGADAAIVGSACVACLERAAVERRDPLAALADLLDVLGRPAR
ncbi:MAG: tryptophan synthase alpha chain [Thermoleophilaceae bacterium]|nr:tryptophan synthase alpha chain [Thermoleophilaceae bacterium]